MTILELAEGLEADKIELLGEVLATDGLLLRVFATRWAAARVDGGWKLTSLESDRPEVMIDNDMKLCTCFGFDGQTCSHMLALEAALNKRARVLGR